MALERSSFFSWLSTSARKMPVSAPAYCALSVGSKLPVVGLGITGVGIGYDIGKGKDPTTSVASGLGGFLAGAGASAGLAAMGTPVGWVVAGGAVVSWGVGFAIEEWGDDLVQGMEDAGKRLQEINPKMTR